MKLFDTQIAPVALTTISVVFVLLLWWIRLLQPLDLVLHDVSVRLSQANERPPEVALVVIDDKALDTFGWPVPDRYLAETLERLLGAGAVAIGVDLYRDKPIPPGAGALHTLLASSERIVMAMKLSSGSSPAILPPQAVRNRTGAFAAVDVPVDPDEVVRRILMYSKDGEQVVPGLSIAVAIKALADVDIHPGPDPDNSASMVLGSARLPKLSTPAGPYRYVDDRGYQRLLGFTTDVNAIERRTLKAVLAPDADLSFAKGKVVFIGTISESVSDRIKLPLKPTYGSVVESGVVLQALAADEFISVASGAVRVPEPLPGWAVYLSVCLLGALVMAGAYSIQTYGWFLFYAAVLIFLSLASGLGLNAARFFVPASPMILSTMLATMTIAVYRYFVLRSEQYALMRFFQTHVSQEVADNIWENRDRIGAGDQSLSDRLFATIVFIDVAGSTIVADKMRSREFTTWIGAFHDAAGAVALAHGAFIDKFLGDGIMLVFGVPIPKLTDTERANDAKNSVACAEDLRKAVHELNRANVASGNPNFEIRIGIHSGFVQAGTIGTERRQQYTVMGSTPAIAARIEALGKTLVKPTGEIPGATVLMSGDTAQLIGGAGQFKCHGHHHLAGIETPIEIWEFISRNVNIRANGIG